MSAQVIKRWEGILSLIWAGIGFGFYQWKNGFYSFWGYFVTVFIAWWGVSLLLAFSGMRSDSRVGVVAGLLTVIGFFTYLFWPRVFL
jgi:hypothetical protein